MSIEQKFEELTGAVQALTAAVERMGVAPEPAAPPKPTEPRAAAAPPVVEDSLLDAVPPAPTDKPLAYEDLTKVLVDLGKALGAAGKTPKEIREVGVACLARVGAAKLPDIKEKPELWPRLVSIIEGVKAGEEP